MYKSTLIVGILASVFTVVGCNTYPAPETPKQAILNAHTAIMRGDEAGFLACFDELTDDERRVCRAGFQVLNAAYRLDLKAEATFGQESECDPVTAGWLSRGMAAAPENIIVMVEGDEVTCQASEQVDADSEDHRWVGYWRGVCRMLVRRDGQWFLGTDRVFRATSLSRWIDQEGGHDLVVSQLEMMLEILERGIERIDAPDMTMDQLREEMLDAVDAASSAGEG